MPFSFYENLIIEKNRSGEPERRWGRSYEAVYPEEGILLSDHPFCILNAPWVSPLEKMAANEFLDFISTEQQLEIAIQHGFRTADGQESILPDSPFTPENGVVVNLTSTNRKILNFPSGNVIARLSDFWLACKP